MSDPAATGTIVPAGDGASACAWPNGGPRFGDMVWGKVKSHPWWPGHVYSIALTDNAEVHRGRRDGLILVAFFGDSSYGWFEPHEIVPFAEHFAEKVAPGGVSARPTFAAAVAEAVDEVARRAALGVLCPCRSPGAFRTHPFDAGYLLVDVPGFDSGADYHPDQVAAARDRFVPRTALDFLLDAAVTQRDAAEAVARSLPRIEMAALFVAYRRAMFAPRDDTYAEAFGVHPDKVRAAEEKAAAERAQRARPLSGKRKTPAEETAPTPGRRRGGAAARLMEKIVPSASAMKVKATKKDQYLLKRRDQPPEPAHRPAPLPDAQEDGPPGFGTDPPTPPLPGSTAEDEDFMLQRRAPPVEPPPPAVQATEGAATEASAPKKAAKTKKARKREREQAAAAGLSAPAGTDAAETKKKKKKKLLSDIDGGAAPNTPSAAGSGKRPAVPSLKLLGDLDGLDLKQVTCDLQNLPLSPFHGAEQRLSEAARSFVLAFRSKHYKKSNENDSPPEESKKTDRPSAAAPDGQQPLNKKKKPAVRPGAGGDPVKAGVKRGPSDRQEEMSVKKKSKIEKIKTLSKEKKTGGGLEQKVTAAARPAATKEKAEASGRKKEPAPVPRMRTPSPTALMMKFPNNSTLPSVASLKARFARFGPLDIDGIRVYWKSNMCRVIYRFKSDAETALSYASSNSMFGQMETQYHIKEVEKSGSEPPAPDAPPQQRSDLRRMETAPFRPGASGNSSPLPMSRALPARTVAVGQQPKSILKKNTEEGGSGAMREVSRVKFVLDTGDSSKVEPSAPPTSAAAGGGNALDSGAPLRGGAKSVGFAPQPPLQPPPRTLQPPMRQQQLQPPRAAATQQVPPPPPVPYQAHTGGMAPQGQLPYPPRNYDGPLPFSSQTSQQLPYPPRPNDGMSAVLPGQPPLPYFPGQQQQQPYPPRSADSLPILSGQPQQQQHIPPAPGAAADIPEWKMSKEAFRDEVWRVMTGIAKLVEPLTDKNGFFPYHLFGGK